MSSLHPIEDRMEQIRNQWTQFSEDDKARLLHWVIEPNEWKMFETFFNVESSQHGVMPDLFVRLEAAFRSKQTFGFHLGIRLAQAFTYLHDEAVAEGAELPPWQPPVPVTGENGIDYLVQTARAFHHEHEPLFSSVVFVLLPTMVLDPIAWKEWVEELILACNSTHIRIIVFDQQPSLTFTELAKRQSQFVRTVEANLQMGQVLEEISKSGSDSDKPQGIFRLAFVKLMDAVGKGNMAEGVKAAAKALEIASGQNWWHLVIGIYFSLGAGWMNAQDFLQALQCYKKAETEASKAQEKGESYGLDLRVKSRFGLISVLISTQMYDKGASTALDTVPLAQELGDELMLLECYRLASYCYEKDKNWQLSLNTGFNALEVGKNMDEEMRQSSTLAFVGQGLLRISKKPSFASFKDSVENQMKGLLGENWKELTSVNNSSKDDEFSSDTL